MKMNKLLLTLLIIFYANSSNSQPLSRAETIKQFSEQSIREFDELFYSEPNIKKRTYYNCSDTVSTENCKISHVLYFDKAGHIISDTLFEDNQHYVINRIYRKNRIDIHKFSSKPHLYLDQYKTSIDSLILDNLKRPIRFYSDGELKKQWQYDENGRILQTIELPTKKYFCKITSYDYLPHAIVVKKTDRFYNKIDTTTETSTFDADDKIVLKKILTRKATLSESEKLIKLEPVKEISRTEFIHNNNECYVKTYYNNSLTHSQDVKYNDSLKILSSRMIKEEKTTQATSCDNNKITEEEYDGPYVRIVEKYLNTNHKLEKKSLFNSRYDLKEYTNYNPYGMATKTLRIEKGKITSYTYSVDN